MASGSFCFPRSEAEGFVTHLSGEAVLPPIVFGDRVYLTAAVPVGEDLPPVYDTAPGAHDGVPGLPGTVPRNSVVP